MNYYLLYWGSFISIVAVTILLAFTVNRFFIRLIQKSSEEIKNDPTNYKFLRRALVALVYIVGFSIAIYTVDSLRTLANSLLAGAGILAVAVGFASQHALGNLVSGVFIIIFKPFRVNDRIRIGERFGIVEDITLRHTVIKDFENKRVIIPNHVISNEVLVNSDYEDERNCRWIDIGISYDSNIKLAKKIMEEEVLNHPMQIDGRTTEQIEKGDPEVPVRVTMLGEYAVSLRAWAWAKDTPDGFTMSCDLLESIKNRFDQEGIEIPFPYRTVVYKKDLNEKEEKIG